MSAQKVLLVLAALMGAAGVALSAAAAHSDSNLNAAATMLLFHAPVVIVTVVAARAGVLRLAIGLGAAIIIILGAVLFSSDISTRAFASRPLFPMAAPMGGMFLIAGWLVLAVAAIAGRKQ